MIATILNTKLEMVASFHSSTKIEVFEWIEHYLGHNNLRRIRTKVDGSRMTIITEEM